MAVTKNQRKKGGARKIGRNLAQCKVYRDRGTREFNKARKQAKHRKALEKKAARKARKLAETEVKAA
jgi:hypothetical protein